MKIVYTSQVCLLLRYRADQALADGAGRTPLDIAVAHANADIVTLYVVKQINSFTLYLAHTLHPTLQGENLVLTLLSPLSATTASSYNTL